MASKKPPKHMETPPFVQPESFMAFNGAMMQGFMVSGQNLAKGLVSLNEEMMSFANKRLATDAETYESLAKCENWNDTVKLQQDWMRATTEDYLAESGKLMGLATRATLSSWAPLYQQADTALAEMGEEAD
jgi:hypothetical protein